MGYRKPDRRPLLSGGYRDIDVESLGSTAGAIDPYGVTIITATATGLVYGLPLPVAGRQKRVVLDYTGATGNLTLAHKSSGDTLNGSTANVITVSSSEQHAVFELVGTSTSNFSVMWSVTPSTVNPGVTFAASTVTGS